MPDSRVAPVPLVPALVLPKKTLWERVKDMASTAMVMAGVVGMFSTVVWFVAKPALASQFCTVAEAEQVKSRIDHHEAKQILHDLDTDKGMLRIEKRLGQIDSRLCLLLAGTKASTKERDACLGQDQ